VPNFVAIGRTGSGIAKPEVVAKMQKTKLRSGVVGEPEMSRPAPPSPRATSGAPTPSTLKAKFHYAIWSQTAGPKLVADLQRAGIWPII